MNLKEITQQLESKGWKRSNNSAFEWWQKDLPNNNPYNADPDETTISLMFGIGMTNILEFSIKLPTGASIILKGYDLASIEALENLIDYYDCEF
jgi:hypothetical protein